MELCRDPGLVLALLLVVCINQIFVIVYDNFGFFLQRALLEQ